MLNLPYIYLGLFWTSKSILKFDNTHGKTIDKPPTQKRPSINRQATKPSQIHPWVYTSVPSVPSGSYSLPLFPSYLTTTSCLLPGRVPKRFPFLQEPTWGHTALPLNKNSNPHHHLPESLQKLLFEQATKPNQSTGRKKSSQVGGHFWTLPKQSCKAPLHKISHTGISILQGGLEHFELGTAEFFGGGWH